MNHTIESILVILYNLTLLGGTAYLVQQYNWSAWWFLLTVLCLVSTKDRCD